MQRVLKIRIERKKKLIVIMYIELMQKKTHTRHCSVCVIAADVFFSSLFHISIQCAYFGFVRVLLTHFMLNSFQFCILLDQYVFSFFFCFFSSFPLFQTIRLTLA